MRYTIQFHYDAVFTCEVDVPETDNAQMEDTALRMARDIAEDADIRQFTLAAENEARILDRR